MAHRFPRRFLREACSDGFGLRKAQAMYAPEPEWKHNTDRQARHALFVGGLCVGQISQWGGSHPEGHQGEWRAWFFSDDEMPQIGGWFKTDDAAREAVEQALKVALTPF